jgi:hypothetical protein
MRKQINRTDLVDISDIKTDRSKPQRERIIEYVHQIKDPYHFMCNGYIITAIHPDVGPSLEDCLQRIIA